MIMRTEAEYIYPLNIFIPFYLYGKIINLVAERAVLFR